MAAAAAPAANRFDSREPENDAEWRAARIYYFEQNKWRFLGGAILIACALYSLSQYAILWDIWLVGGVAFSASCLIAWIHPENPGEPLSGELHVIHALSLTASVVLVTGTMLPLVGRHSFGYHSRLFIFSIAHKFFEYAIAEMVPLWEQWPSPGDGQLYPNKIFARGQ